jgi:hypothetical protein
MLPHRATLSTFVPEESVGSIGTDWISFDAENISGLGQG